MLKDAVEGKLTSEWRKNKRLNENGSQLLERILNDRRKRWEDRKMNEFSQQNKTPPKDWKEKYPHSEQLNTKNLARLPDGWIWARIDQVGEVQLGRQRAPKFHSGINMVPYLRVANVFEDRIDISDVMEMHFSESDEEKFKLVPGDVLLNEGQSLELVGRPAIFRGELKRVCFTNTLVRFRSESNVLPEYALIVFLNYMHSGRFRKIAKITTNIAHLGAGRFAELEFPLPSFEEQTEIVCLWKTLMTEIDSQNQAINFAIRQSCAQKKNIFRAAFSGQLVPQDQNDEPASVLLKRIITQRSEQQKLPKKRKPKQKEISIVARKLVDVLTEAKDWLPAQEAFRLCGLANGAEVEKIEALYAELRSLDKKNLLQVDVIRDDQGRKIADRIKLVE